MKKYHIKVIVGNNLEDFTVTADYFSSQTSNGNSSGFYSFYLEKNFVASYPIERTIITSVENLTNN
jgi:hypothetical protein